jgi:hypothetical protein
MYKPEKSELDVVVDTYNPSTLEAEVGIGQVQSQPGLYPPSPTKKI